MAIFTGRNVEEAIETGLNELGIPRLKARIKVISKDKKGFLGFGKKPAQVDISRLEDAQAADKKPTTVTSIFKDRPKATTDLDEKDLLSDSQVAESTTTAELETAADQVTAYVQKIIYEMDVDASIETTISRRRINLQIETTEAGRVIGYHGKVLKALQLLAQNYLYDHYDRHYSVSINVHDYVEHRTETLIDFTQKIAARVIESGRPYDMDPMSNSERKTVHKTISQIDGVSSYSEGDDPNRYVVVTLSED